MHDELKLEAEALERFRASVRMAAERLSCEAQSTAGSIEGGALRGKMGSIARDLFQADGTMIEALRTLPPANTEADVERLRGLLERGWYRPGESYPVLSADADAWIKKVTQVGLATISALSLTRTAGGGEVERLRKTLEPFAAMGRVMETRAIVTFGKMPADQKVVCESSGEAGLGILTMGHFRDAAALLPTAQGWTGMYRPPFDRAALATPQQVKEGDRHG